MAKLLERVEEIAASMQRSYEADIDLLTRRDKAHVKRIAELEAERAAPAVTLPDEVIYAMKVFAYPGDGTRTLEDLWIAAKILRVFLSKMKGGSDGTI